MPYTKYGKLEGIISLIPFDTDYSEQSYYSVEVTINKKYMSSKKEIITLRVGTKVSAKIVVDANTIFQKFFQKIIDYAN